MCVSLCLLLHNYEPVSYFVIRVEVLIRDVTPCSLEEIYIHLGERHYSVCIYICILFGGAYIQGELAGACEYGNEPSGSIKCGDFLD